MFLTLLMMVTGIVLSRDLFPLFHLEDDFIIRQLHTFSSNWGLLGMGFHLGFHWQMILGMFARSFGQLGRSLLWPGRLVMAGMVAYGIAAFFRLALGSKLLMQTTFGYWDFETDAPGFFLSYLAVLSIAIALAHYIHRK
ncbi:MAG TPA: DUF4405 domain-containing protein [Candidatus Limiplasma sp.]|nr:DUF4405 domain-containing protein [Candidatus Limiplasma sp.]HPR77742.1 DUF4405 domain-containing protein [Candidatus Limiplasma sp.]